MIEGDIIKLSSLTLEVNKGKQQITGLKCIPYTETALCLNGVPMAFHTNNHQIISISGQLKHRLRKKSVFCHVPYPYQLHVPERIKRRSLVRPKDRFLYRYDSYEIPFTSQDHDLWFDYFRDKEIKEDSRNFYSFFQPLTFYIVPFAQHLRVLKLMQP